MDNSSEEYNAKSNEEGLSITTSSTTNNNLRTNNTTSSFLEDENEEDTEEVVEDLEDLSEEMNDDFSGDDDDIEGEYFMNQFQWRGYFAQDLYEDEEDNDFYSRALVSDNLENIYEICELGRNFSSEDEEEEEINNNNSSVNNNAFITIRHAIQQSKKKKQKIGLIHPSIKRNELTFKFDWKKRSNLTIEKTLFSIVNDPQFLSRESKLFILQSSSNSSSLGNDNNFEQKKDNNIQYIIKKNNEEGNMYDIYKYLKYPEYNYIIVKPNLGNLFSIWSVQFPKYVTIEQKVYFEVTILQFKQDDIVCIGLAEHGYNTSKVFLDRETGWDNHSIGYHSDDGGMFDSEGFHSKRSSTYGKGDTIGCFWDLQKGTVIYTKNGKFINFKANRPLEKYGDFLPIITGRNRSGSIYLAVNFGTAPFVCGLFNEFYVMNYLNINLYQKVVRKEFIDVNVITKE